MFKCDMCASCCKNLDKSNIYAELDSGNGTCKYLNNNKCTIYNNRPLLCRVDESYKVFFEKTVSIDEYYRLNRLCCVELKKIRK